MGGYESIEGSHHDLIHDFYSFVHESRDAHFVERAGNSRMRPGGGGIGQNGGRVRPSVRPSEAPAESLGKRAKARRGADGTTRPGRGQRRPGALLPFPPSSLSPRGSARVDLRALGGDTVARPALGARGERAKEPMGFHERVAKGAALNVARSKRFVSYQSRAVE